MASPYRLGDWVAVRVPDLTCARGERVRIMMVADFVTATGYYTLKRWKNPASREIEGINVTGASIYGKVPRPLAARDDVG